MREFYGFHNVSFETNHWKLNTLNITLRNNLSLRKQSRPKKWKDWKRPPCLWIDSLGYWSTLSLYGVQPQRQQCHASMLHGTIYLTRGSLTMTHSGIYFDCIFWPITRLYCPIESITLSHLVSNQEKWPCYKMKTVSWYKSKFFWLYTSHIFRIQCQKKTLRICCNCDFY